MGRPLSWDRWWVWTRQRRAVAPGLGARHHAAFRQLGGTIREREPRRYEITHVPAAVRSRDRLIGTREPVLPRYERITFQKDLISVLGKPLAAFVCPGHPLHRSQLKGLPK